jgi:CRP-like cAMP-binding protein
MMAADHPERFVDLADGDVFGLLSRSSRAMVPPAVMALTDCEVIRIDAEVASAVAGRNPRMTDVLNQILISRSRRLQPSAEAHSIEIPAPGGLSPNGDDVAPPDPTEAEPPA